MAISEFLIKNWSSGVFNPEIEAKLAVPALLDNYFNTYKIFSLSSR